MSSVGTAEALLLPACRTGVKLAGVHLMCHRLRRSSCRRRTAQQAHLLAAQPQHQAQLPDQNYRGVWHCCLRWALPCAQHHTILCTWQIIMWICSFYVQCKCSLTRQGRAAREEGNPAQGFRGVQQALDGHAKATPRLGNSYVKDVQRLWHADEYEF